MSFILIMNVFDRLEFENLFSYFIEFKMNDKSVITEKETVSIQYPYTIIITISISREQRFLDINYHSLYLNYFVSM